MLVIKNTPTANALRSAQGMAESLNYIADMRFRRGTYGGPVSNVLYEEETQKELDDIRKKQKTATDKLEDESPLTRGVAAAMREMETNKDIGGFGLKSGKSLIGEYDKDYQKGLSKGNEDYWYGTDAHEAAKELGVVTKKHGARRDVEGPYSENREAAPDILKAEAEEKDRESAYKADHSKMGYGVGLNEEVSDPDDPGFGPRATDKLKELEREYVAEERVEVQKKAPEFAKQYEKLTKHYDKLEETGKLQEQSKKFSDKAKKLRKMTEIHPRIIPGNTREEQYSYVFRNLDESMAEAKTRTEKLDAWRKAQANMMNLDRYWEKDDASKYFSPALLKAYLGDGGKKPGRGGKTDYHTYAFEGTKDGKHHAFQVHLTEGTSGALIASKVRKMLSSEDLKDRDKVVAALNKLGTDGAKLAALVEQGHATLDHIEVMQPYNDGQVAKMTASRNKELSQSMANKTPKEKKAHLQTEGIPLQSYLRAVPGELDMFRRGKAITDDEYYAFVSKFGTREQKERAARERELLSRIGGGITPSFGKDKDK